jgi:DNA-binding FadR family transcriptional regulator
MSAVPELLTEGAKYTWKQITGDRKRLKKANPVNLWPELARKSFLMPDGTTMREMAVTGEEVFLGHWEACRSGIEEELGRALTEDEYEAPAINFGELLAPTLLHTCEGEATWINESGLEPYEDPEFHKLLAEASRDPAMTTFYKAISRTTRKD